MHDAGPSGTRVLIEWAYTPQQCFEQELSVLVAGHTLCIAQGKAAVELGADEFRAKPHLRDDFFNAIHYRLRGVQLVTGQPFELHETGETFTHPDGKTNWN